jgi:hypothetical protein
MSLDKDIFEEIFFELGEGYVGEVEKILVFKRKEISETVTSKGTGMEFAHLAAAIFKSEKQLAKYSENLLEIGILIGFMYKEKELAKDASKQRIVT